MAFILLFDRIDSITDPARPRLSRREKMAAMFGGGVVCGFMTLTNIVSAQPPVLVLLCLVGFAFAIALIAMYGLLFIVPMEANEA